MRSSQPWQAFDAAWFRRHQARLLWWLNGGRLRRAVSRWALRLDTAADLAEIGPHYYRVALGDGRHRATFRTHAKYSKRLYHALAPLWWCLHFIDWALLDRLVPALSFGFATLTAYPQAGSGGSNVTCDGYLQWTGTNETWANIHDAASATSTSMTSTSTAMLRVNAGTTTDRYSTFRRSGFSFDTSAIGSGQTVSATDLGIRFTAKASEYSAIDNSVDIVSFAPAAHNAWVNNDWDAFGSTSWANKTYDEVIDTAYVVFALSAAGYGAVSATGVTDIGMLLGCDRANTPPTWGSGNVTAISGYFADQTGETNDPYLTVTYAATPTGGRTYAMGLGLGDMMVI